MSDTHSEGARKYRERDAQIVRGLCSKNHAERDDAAQCLQRKLRRPLAKTLCRIARRSTSECFELILDENLCLNETEFDDIWQETVIIVLQNAERGNLTDTSNLLAYMVTVAKRRVKEHWDGRCGRQLEADIAELLMAPSDDAEILAKERNEEIVQAIEDFYDTLKKPDQVALGIGMRLKTSDRANDKSMKKLAAKIRQSGAWGGQTATISRRYNRLREKLRKYLEDRGYDNV